MSICVVRRRVYTFVYARIYVLSLIDSCVLRRASWRESRKESLANPLCRSPAFNVKFIKARMCVYHKHHSIEVFRVNVHVKFFESNALLLQHVVQTMVNAIIT